MTTILRASKGPLAALIVALAAGAQAQAQAQCDVDELTSGLQVPLGIAQTNKGNLIVGESGTTTPNSGRISIVDPASGERRTLVDGLPSGPNDIGEPSGPAGVFLRGRTLYVAIGVGDAVIAGPVPTRQLPNPDGPSSPIVSSVLAIHMSAHAERITDGFTLTLDDHEALAAGERVTLSNGAGDRVTVALVADFEDFIPDPDAGFEDAVRGSNPFDLVVVGNHAFVTDGGRNLLWKVELGSGEVSELATFATVPNPFPVGAPVTEAVPTGITFSDGRLLVSLFSGVPFGPGQSRIQAVDPKSGAQTPLLEGLKTAIEIVPIRDGADTDWLVLHHATTGLFFGSAGALVRFEELDEAPTVVAGGPATAPFCLTRPSSMVVDEKTGTVYVVEVGGRLVAIPLAS